MTSFLTQGRLKELLDYCPDTGVFKWKVANGRRIHVGDVAGSTRRNGYLVIGVDGRIYRAHRLAWFYVKGQWPEHYIDHINGVVDDNRLANLRDVIHSVNSENQKIAPTSNKSCGVLGVSREKNHRRWRAVITTGRKQIHIGYFDSVEEAHNAYLAAKRQLHLGCTI
jgi:hypothetical protein